MKINTPEYFGEKAHQIFINYKPKKKTKTATTS